MKTALLPGCLFVAPTAASAQDAAITNVRIVGNGSVSESGTIVIRGGKIASVSAGSVTTQGLTVINGAGMTAVPGCMSLPSDPTSQGRQKSMRISLAQVVRLRRSNAGR
jgi:alpha-D-ribose 1-methylphosphonate 5-triphosphate diphosphatase PhnM